MNKRERLVEAYLAGQVGLEALAEEDRAWLTAVGGVPDLRENNPPADLDRFIAREEVKGGDHE